MKTEPEIMQRVREMCLCCQDCAEFYRHYVFSGDTGEFMAIPRGHCASQYRRLRNDVGAGDIACRHFVMRDRTND